MPARKTHTSKTAKIQEAKQTEVLTSVKELGGLDKVTQSIAKTQVEIQKSLAGLSGTLVEKLDELAAVEAAIALKEGELRTLNEIEVTAGTLDALTQEIETRRADWAKEQETTAKAFKEQQDERRKQWAREAEEYAYKDGQNKRAAEDAWRSQQAKSAKDAADKLEAFNKSMAEREAAMKAREAEFARLQAFEAGHAEAVKKAVSAAESVLGNTLKRDYETKAQLASKDAEVAGKMAEATVSGLRSQLAERDGTISGLRAELARAHADAKEIATAAVNAQSGREALSVMQRSQETSGAALPKAGR